MVRSALVLFATRQGQTEKVAQVICGHLQQQGISTHLVNAKALVDSEQPMDLASYDLLVFGASMHAGGLESEFVEFINQHADQIQLKSRSIFLVLLSAATKNLELKTKWLADAQHKMERQLVVKFEDTEMIAGALAYSKYSRPVKWLMQKISRKAGEGTDTSKDYEYTDWQQVERYASKLANK